MRHDRIGEERSMKSTSSTAAMKLQIDRFASFHGQFKKFCFMERNFVENIPWKVWLGYGLSRFPQDLSGIFVERWSTSSIQENDQNQ